MSKHNDACKRYREKIYDRRGYLYCEKCGVNQNGSFRFSTHHIVYASEVPKHEFLHDEKNLIFLCERCHNFFHESKKNRDYLVKERGLNKLFNKNLLYE